MSKNSINFFLEKILRNISIIPKIKIRQLILPKIKWIKRLKSQINYDLITKILGWYMKVIGKTGSGKLSFVSAFTNFLIKYINIKDIYFILQLQIKKDGIKFVIKLLFLIPLNLSKTSVMHLFVMTLKYNSKIIKY